MQAHQLRRVLGREYGKGWERRFSRFDDEPVAAASIGQVQRDAVGSLLERLGFSVSPPELRAKHEVEPSEILAHREIRAA